MPVMSKDQSSKLQQDLETLARERESKLQRQIEEEESQDQP